MMLLQQSIKLKDVALALLVATTMLALSSGQSSAQRRVDSIPTTKGCYRQPITPISQVLSLKSDMPLDCIFGYLYFDSLCRGVQSAQQLDSMIALVNSWDTLRIFMRFMYKMQEYDADLFEEYLYGAAGIAPSYRLSPAHVNFKFIQQMRKVLGQKNKLAYLSVAPVILHIHVVDVQSDQDSLCSVPIWPYPLKCVRALVVDTVKGKNLRPGDPFTGFNAFLKKNKVTESLEPWIDIAYSPVAAKSYTRGDNFSSAPVFHCDSCFGSSALQSGKDYLVFLEDGFIDYDGTYSYYEYQPYTSYNENGGIFPIDDSGNVLIQDNYFGYGTSVPLITFEALLKADIQSIVSH
jgi:hypothetical protein